MHERAKPGALHVPNCHRPERFGTGSESAADVPESIKAAAASTGVHRATRSKDERAIEPPSARGRSRCAHEKNARATKPRAGLDRAPGSRLLFYAVRAPTAANRPPGRPRCLRFG